MGDISSEPSMEEILSSIKRIIAEEGDTTPGARSRRPGRAGPSAPAPRVPVEEEVLELSDRVSGIDDQPAAAPEPAAREPIETKAESILSDRTAEASRQPLEALSRMMVKPDKPEPPESNTLEGQVREMLKPMLREWLDTNLPGIVETMVAREIARISGRD